VPPDPAPPAAPAAGILIVGYGNTLRQDDGVGPHVAQLLTQDGRFDGAVILALHQLVPELVDDLARARRAVLIDARRAGSAPGTVTTRVVRPEGTASSLGSHVLDPAMLLGLAKGLRHADPPTYLVSVTAGSLELGEGLSPAVQTAVPQMHAAVVHAALGSGNDPPNA
jgi:hydrogenase maturation protease